MARRGRTLTEEERALWRKVARSLVPRQMDPAPEQSTVKPPIPNAPPPVPRPIQSPRSLRPGGQAEPHIRLPTPPPTPPSGLDKRTAERLRKGRRAPDDRLDLHGMTANRAHAALNQFIAGSRARGLRCVLVITGKGGFGGPRGFGDPAPGVLRREVPVWLQTPPLSGMVVHVSQAHPRHGGGGALYVYLRKSR